MSVAKIYNGLVGEVEQAIDYKYLPEPDRARIHELTRKVTVTDAQLEEIAAAIRLAGFYKVHAAVSALRDLRDRYEDLGKYAINAPDRSETVNHPAWRALALTLSPEGAKAFATILTLSADDIAAIPRKVTLSDEDLTALIMQTTDRPDIMALIFDLRDRYEERGKYAITAPEAPAPSR